MQLYLVRHAEVARGERHDLRRLTAAAPTGGADPEFPPAGVAGSPL